MKKTAIYILLAAALTGCTKEEIINGRDSADLTRPTGEPITEIRIGMEQAANPSAVNTKSTATDEDSAADMQTAAHATDGTQAAAISFTTEKWSEDPKTRVGVTVDPARVQDKYFWTAGDQLIVCELNAAGNAFTYNNFVYTITDVPTTAGAPASFSGTGMVATGNYIVLHCRNSSTLLELPINATKNTIKYTIPTLTQTRQLTGGTSPDDLSAAQAFADNLFFSTGKVSAVNLASGSATLAHQLVQVDVTVKGQPADAAKKIARVDLAPTTATAYASKLIIAANTGTVTGNISENGNGLPVTVVSDPLNPTVGSDYRVRLLARPMDLATPAANRVNVRVYSGMNYGRVIAPVTQAINPNKIYTLDLTVGNINTEIPQTPLDQSYVGAFWRKDQIGERLINNYSIVAANAGAWTASVVWMDDCWTDGDIVLDAPTTLPTYNTALSSADPEAANAGWIAATTTTTVSGSVATNGNIYFRIGLKSKFEDNPKYSATPDWTTTFPARYAVIALTYANGKYTKFIYLRQGEEADYMGGTDVKWLVYNSKPTTYATTIAGQLPIVTTNYPTQAGGFKQWLSTTGFFSPSDPRTPNVLWNNTDTAISIGELANICPSGYKVPTGDPSGGSYPVVGEMGLLFTVNTTTFWGYYADGYFDRRIITNGSGSNAGLKSTVSDNTDDVAYMGRLFFDNDIKRSVFFPAAGYRTGGNGTFDVAGSHGAYWSNSPSGTSTRQSIFMHFRSDMTGTQGATFRNFGMNIRCIKEPEPPTIDMGGYTIRIANTDVGGMMSWVSAMGLSTTYENQRWESTDTGPYNTGCKAYSEQGATSGWRVATIAELRQIRNNRGILSSSFSTLTMLADDTYWSGTQQIGYTGSYNSMLIHFGNGNESEWDKRVTRRVRCVLQL